MPVLYDNVKLRSAVKFYDAISTPDVEITSVDSILFVGVSATVSGICAPSTNTITVSINGIGFGSIDTENGMWSIVGIPTAAMVGNDVTVEASVFAASDTTTTDVTYPLFYNNQASLTQTDINMRVLTGALTIYWGDGNTTAVTCNNTLQSINYNYSSIGQYKVGVIGNIENIRDVRALGESQLSGDIGWFANFTTLEQLYMSNTALEGDIAPINNLASTLTLLWAANASVSGDLGDIYQTTSLTQLLLGNNNVVYDNTTSIAWSEIDLRVQDNTWSAATVDRFFIDLAAGGGINGTLFIGGNNASRTAAATSAYNTLISNGWTVNE
jgi:hypothetical protein